MTSRVAPPISVCTGLRAANTRGVLCTTEVLTLTLAGFMLSRSPGFAWLAGQSLLAIAFVQWFIVLHECGHETLFRSSRLNRIVGHVASFFSLIPFQCWKRVHASHHQWTGWQDLDPTTASLVPRPLRAIERVLINFSWRFWIPTFSILYRLNNYWNVPRLRRLYGASRKWPRMVLNTLLLTIVYIATLISAGPWQVIAVAGASLLVAFVLEDLLILSQHTHIPQSLSGGAKVQPFTAAEQETFTRSLRFPLWVSNYLLFNFDAHELHHMYPFVPGYHLRRISYVGRNEVDWWTWIRTVKRMRGEQFLFGNQNDSSIRV